MLQNAKSAVAEKGCRYVPAKLDYMMQGRTPPSCFHLFTCRPIYVHFFQNDMIIVCRSAILSNSKGSEGTISLATCNLLRWPCS